MIIPLQEAVSMFEHGAIENINTPTDMKEAIIMALYDGSKKYLEVCNVFESLRKNSA